MSTFSKSASVRSNLFNLNLIFMFILWIITFLIFTSVSLHAEVKQAADSAATNWCGTMGQFAKELGIDEKSASSVCGQWGNCDNAFTRDSWIPDPDEPIMYIRMVIHLLAESDGSNPISSDAEAWAKVDSLNADFAPARIQFIVELNHINNSTWRVISQDDVDLMKYYTAIDPASKLNVWATGVQFDYSYATFPFSSNALSATGGIIMGHFHWGTGAHQTFAHEIGHCLGLFHTFQGAGEAESCNACGEWPGVVAPDQRGDFCSDTPPTPTVTNCGNAGGASICGDQLPWGYTQPENYMGYTPQTCRTLFTEQQRGRMRCWSEDALDSWVLPFVVDIDTVLGEVPMTVAFNPSTHKAAESWLWQFGDGESSTAVSPTHEYDEPGFYTVSVDMQTVSGSYQRDLTGLVSVYADTIRIDNILAELGVSTRVDIYVNNHLPLKQITIPFTWVGPLNIVWDSFSTAGLRTDYFEKKSQAYNITIRRAMVRLICSTSGSQPYLEPGTGPVASLYFTNLQATSGLITPIKIETYAVYDMDFLTYAGNYEPHTEDGSVRFACCEPPTVGNINCAGIIDIGDVTVMIQNLFITLANPCCLEEADIDMSGVVDIGDLTSLIASLFITLLPLPACP